MRLIKPSTARRILEPAPRGYGRAISIPAGEREAGLEFRQDRSERALARRVRAKMVEVGRHGRQWPSTKRQVMHDCEGTLTL